MQWEKKNIKNVSQVTAITTCKEILFCPLFCGVYVFNPLLTSPFKNVPGNFQHRISPKNFKKYIYLFENICLNCSDISDFMINFFTFIIWKILLIITQCQQYKQPKPAI